MTMSFGEAVVTELSRFTRNSSGTLDSSSVSTLHARFMQKPFSFQKGHSLKRLTL